ncbi:MAG: hypothetical protein M1812_003990 [Candelaria pacifica]|nr:MAG: hypothetical protein M1812_003990 [Candelaria pacifica]
MAEIPLGVGGIVIGGIALLHPAIKACRSAYGTYKLTEAFGTDYRQMYRKLCGQMARLEELSNLKLSELVEVPASGTRLFSVILGELGAMRQAFQRCEDLMRLYAGKEAELETRLHSFPTSSSWTPETSVSSTTSPPVKSLGTARVKGFFRRKVKRSSDSIALRSLPNLHQPTQAAIPTIALQASVEESTSTASTGTSRHQESTRLLQRLKWATSDREKFSKCVKELIASNDVLESLVRIKALKDNTLLHGSTKKDPRPTKEVAQIQSSLQRLHTALAAMNKWNDEHLDFGIKLATDHQNVRDDLGEHEDLALRPESYAFLLQAHFDDQKQSHLLIAETLHSPPSACPTANGAGSGDPATGSIRQKLHTSPRSAQDSFFQALGDIKPSKDLADTHALFQDVSAEWLAGKTLQDFLAVDTFRSQSFIIQRISLALLMTMSQLYLRSTPLAGSSPQPKDYRYYKQCSADLDRPSTVSDPSSQLTDITKESFLNPYLVYGFGSPSLKQKSKAAAIGSSSGVPPPPKAPIVELGLLLHQIGCWSPLDSGLEDSLFETTKSQARNQTHDVVRHTGMQYAEIVQSCLDYLEQSGVNEEEFLFSVVMALKKGLQSLRF